MKACSFVAALVAFLLDVLKLMIVLFFVIVIVF